MKLYLLPAAFAEVEQALAEEGDITPDLAARLDALDMELKAKLEACCRVWRRLEAEAATYASEASRLRAQAEIAAGRSAWLKRYMDEALQRLGIDRIETELFKLARQLNPPAVTLASNFCLDKLPRQFVRFVPAHYEPDKKTILEAHKAGQELPPGVTVTQTRSLRIR